MILVLGDVERGIDVDSILHSVKKHLSIAEDDHSFDTHILSYINTAFELLREQCVGPCSGFSIDDESATWDSYVPKGPVLDFAQVYVYRFVGQKYDELRASEREQENLGTRGILSSVKKMLGIADDYDHFDADIIMHINSVFLILKQLGVGPSAGFYITSEKELWTDFIPASPLLESIKSYVYLKVRLIFDPPASSSTMNAMNSLISELEWRINVAVDPADSTAN